MTSTSVDSGEEVEAFFDAALLAGREVFFFAKTLLDNDVDLAGTDTAGMSAEDDRLDLLLNL